jgi:hypothetical protein
MATKEELLQAAQDAKNQPKIDAAYSASLTNTEEKPGQLTGVAAMMEAGKKAKTEQLANEAKDPFIKRKREADERVTAAKTLADRVRQESRSSVRMKDSQTKYAKGGVTRADGCISKGHTKGRMI